MKKKFIGVIGIVIVVIVGGIYYLTREEKIELSLKNKKEIIKEEKQENEKKSDCGSYSGSDDSIFSRMRKW